MPYLPFCMNRAIIPSVMTEGALAHGVLPETVRSQTADAVELEVEIPAECDYFDGHFPEMKLLPAVAQIDLVTLYATRYFGVSRAVKSVRRFKFSEKIFPGTRVVFSLSFNREKATVTFKLTDAASGTAYSSGSYSAL